MRQQEDHWEAGEPSDEELRLIARIIQEVWRRAGWLLTSDLRDDCASEAALTLWQMREKLAGLPAAEREDYRATCVRHAVYRFVGRELSQAKRSFSLEAIQASERPINELVVESMADWQALKQESLLEQVSRDEFAAALRTLSDRDRELLDLHFVLELSDTEIAERLQSTREAVRRQRNRVIAKLRKLLRPKEANP